VVNALSEPVRAPSSRAPTSRAPTGRSCRATALAPDLGARLLSATVLELEPGEAAEPYHYVYGRERWLLVLTGRATIRHPGGEDVLAPVDVACFPDGPAGAHQLLNRSADVVRALSLSTAGLPANTYFPDTDSWLLENAPGNNTEL
jgi:uncharacterized cupin superfamily protein